MDPRYDTFWPRFAAGLIDVLVLWPVSKLLDLAAASASFPLVTYTALTLDTSVTFFYSIYLHGRFGQTIGKWMMKVQVISIDERPLSMKQAFLRDAVPLALSVLYLLFAITPVFAGFSPDSKAFDQGAFALLGHAALVWALLEIGTMLTNAKRRAIHDFIARSVVVRRSNLTPNADARPEEPRAG